MQKVKEGIMHALFLICACVSILAVVLICVYLFASGVPAIGEIGVTDFLFGTKWKPSSGYYGIFPMIIGSILVTGIAVVIGVLPEEALPLREARDKPSRRDPVHRIRILRSGGYSSHHEGAVRRLG